MNIFEKLIKALQEKVDISSLVLFRIAFGGIMLWEVTRYFSKGWISRYYMQPKFYFTYEWFPWVHPWEGEGMYIHFFVLGLLAIFILLGLFYRISTTLFFFGFTYIFLLDKTNYLNHFYLISILSFIMIFLPAHRSFSLDTLIWPQIRTNYISAWPVWLLRFQLGVAYFYGGIAKISADWLNGQPMSMWLRPFEDLPVIGPLFLEPWMGYFFSYSGLILDLFIVPFLLWKRTRIPAFLIITLFHLMNSQLFVIGIFPWFMIVATTIYFEPSWVRKAVDSIFKFDFPKYTNVSRKITFSYPLFAFFMLFAAVQLLVPFRHFLYAGNVNWNEQGHRFSWHMKLRSKVGKGVFEVTNLDNGQKFEIDSKKFLTKRQNKKMLAHPDMVLQFANYIEEMLAAKGLDNVEVLAKVRAKLNGRPYYPMVNPEVNLLTIGPDTPHQNWITQLDIPLRK